MIKRAQVTLEYTIIIGLLLALMVGVFFAIGFHLNDAEKDIKQTHIKSLQNLILNEIKRAQMVEEGYTRIVQLPPIRGGSNYSLLFDEREKLLTVHYLGLAGYITVNATGNICISSSASSLQVKVSKQGNAISLESCPECAYTLQQCDTAQHQGVCSTIDARECCLNHCRCC